MANPVVFRKNVNVGAADAESDNAYLTHCFIDTGDLDQLLDCNNPRCIVLGRTGTGKTALLQQILKQGPNVCELLPETLSLNYIANSNIIKFFEKIGVDLNIFYCLLWRHILTVELLNLKFKLNNEAAQVRFFDFISNIFGFNKSKQRALNYIKEWGDKFWESTENRIKEFTRTLESKLSAAASAGIDVAHLGAEATKSLTEEQKVEILHRGTQVVNNVQIKELHEVISLLGEDIFNDPMDKYYIVIDKLDEGWVDDSIRFKLVKALIETIKTFRNIEPVKIIIALRTDLHFRVLKETVQPGFQEEKYQSLYLNVKWSRDQLVKLLDSRVNFMFKRQYTSEKVTLADIMPSNQMDKKSSVDYLIERTFFRPREAIMFLNECISRSTGKSRITAEILRQAEVPYSQQRLRSLADEWRREYPNLLEYTKLIERRQTPCELSSLDQVDYDEFCEHIIEGISDENDPVYQACSEYYIANIKKEMPLLETVVSILYQVGLVGVKPEPHLGRQWSFEGQPVLSRGQLKSTSTIEVHKTFWAALGVTTRGRDTSNRGKK